VLVNNASAPFSHGYDMDHWLVTAETDFIGSLVTTRYAIEAMRGAGAGGAIVNVSSISALWHGRPAGAPVYDAAKAGLVRFTTGLADLAKTDKIRVNCLAPGWIATDGPRQYWESLTPEQRIERGVPASLLTTNQIAGAVVRLATDESLAGRIVLWWSDDEPKVVEWGRSWVPEIVALQFPLTPRASRGWTSARCLASRITHSFAPTEFTVAENGLTGSLPTAFTARFRTRVNFWLSPHNVQ
jgi:NAD(P)-dependent dehydrogenase (short-subunit alcohol dehydrogenase family)